MKPANPRILIINGGSSSIKFGLFEADDSPRRILAGGIERIGLPDASLRVKGLNQADNFSRPVTAPNHTAAVGALSATPGAVARGQLQYREYGTRPVAFAPGERSRRGHGAAQYAGLPARLSAQAG